MDNYEYGVTWSNGLGAHFPIFEDEWGTYEWAHDQALQERSESSREDVKIMRRIKAGEPEDFLLYVD